MHTPAADWVTFDTSKTQGLDLLGLRAPVQNIGNKLMNGLTTVTPKLRYLSVLSWIIWRYNEARLPDDWAQFRKFAAAQEAVIVMANVLHDRTTLRLVGVGKAIELVDSNKSTLPLDPLVDNIAFDIYASASEQLGLSFARGAGVNGLSEERGLNLARAFDAPVSPTVYGKRLAIKRQVAHVPRKDLEELSNILSLDILPPKETKILIDSIMPTHLENLGERRRLETFSLLLWLSAQSHAELDENRVFQEACKPSVNIPVALCETLDGWLDYVIRDVLAVAHEAVFGAVMSQVDVATAKNYGPAAAVDVTAILLNSVEEHNDCLRGLGIIGENESVRDIKFHQVMQRVHGLCRENETFENGLRRWDGGLSEHHLSDVALRSRNASVALLPVVWCLTAWRLTPMSGDIVSSSRQVFAIGGLFQIGLQDVVCPKLEEYCRLGTSYMQVMADLLIRTVQQHLRVAWTRFSPPNGKDVSVLIADTETWARNNGFNAGQTDSRLSIAIDWLRQLGLIDQGQITDAGQAALSRALNTLGKT